MSEADILALTYEDTVTVYRPVKDCHEGESRFRSGSDGDIVYENIACALSTHAGGKLEQSRSTARTAVTYSLFVRPEIDIQPNDYLVILQQGRKKVTAKAGHPDCKLSHNNIPLVLESEVV